MEKLPIVFFCSLHSRIPNPQSTSIRGSFLEIFSKKYLGSWTYPVGTAGYIFQPCLSERVPSGP